MEISLSHKEGYLQRQLLKISLFQIQKIVSLEKIDVLSFAPLFQFES